MLEFLSKNFYGNSIQECLLAFAIISGSIIIGKIVYFISSRVLRKIASRTKTQLDDIIIDRFERPVILALIIMGIWIGVNTRHINTILESWLSKAYISLIAVNIT